MSVIKANLAVSPQEIFTSSSTQGTDIGALATSGDGRYFRYCLMGGVTAVIGKVYQGPAEDATNQSPAGGLSVSAAAVGATSVSTTTTVTLAANLLAGGFLTVVIGPNVGANYKIASHAAYTTAAATFQLEDPIFSTAWTTSTKIVLHQNPYSNCVVAATTLTAAPVGVAVYAITNAQYGWLQTHGPASCLITGTFASAGLAVGCLVGGTAGSLAPAIAGTNVLGYTMGIGATTEYDSVFLQID